MNWHNRNNESVFLIRPFVPRNHLHHNNRIIIVSYTERRHWTCTALVTANGETLIQGIHPSSQLPGDVSNTHSSLLENANWIPPCDGQQRMPYWLLQISGISPINSLSSSRTSSSSSHNNFYYCDVQRNYSITINLPCLKFHAYEAGCVPNSSERTFLRCSSGPPAGIVNRVESSLLQSREYDKL